MFSRLLPARSFVRRCSKIRLDECPKPVPPMNVTITSATSDIGSLVALLLKRCSYINRVTLHDTVDTSTIAEDLCTINTACEVRNYCGRQELKEALEEARILILCGGHQRCPGETEEEMFKKNAHEVRQIVMHCMEYNPYAHICVLTPPINAIVPMIIEEAKKADVINHERVYGLATLNVIRANSITAEWLKISANEVICNVVGGDHRRLMIPILSQLVPPQSHMSLIDCENISRKIQEAGEDVLHVKSAELDIQGCYLSSSYAAYKFITSLALTLNGKKEAVECVFAKQQSPLDEIARYLTTTVKLDRNGIASIRIPKLSKYEEMRLRNALEEINENIFLGESYVTGDDSAVVPRGNEQCTFLEGQEKICKEDDKSKAKEKSLKIISCDFREQLRIK